MFDLLDDAVFVISDTQPETVGVARAYELLRTIVKIVGANGILADDISEHAGTYRVAVRTKTGVFGLYVRADVVDQDMFAVILYPMPGKWVVNAQRSGSGIFTNTPASEMSRAQLVYLLREILSNISSTVIKDVMSMQAWLQWLLDIRGMPFDLQ